MKNYIRANNITIPLITGYGISSTGNKFHVTDKFILFITNQTAYLYDIISDIIIWSFTNTIASTSFNAAYTDNNNFYVGTTLVNNGNGSVLFKLDEFGDIISQVNIGNTIHDIQVDSNGNVYVGCRDNILRIYNNDLSTLLDSYSLGNTVNSSPLFRHGESIYAGSYGKVTKFINGEIVWEYMFTGSFVYDIAVSRDGTIIASANNNMIHKIVGNGNGESFTLETTSTPYGIAV